MALYELRQYQVRPGKMDAWLKLMEGEIIPFQVSKGVVISGSFRGETDETIYIWMRRFKSEEERERLYQVIYESDFWKNVIRPQVIELIDREAAVVTRLVPTDLSILH